MAHEPRFLGASHWRSNVQSESTAVSHVGTAVLAHVNPIWTLLLLNERGFTYKRDTAGTFVLDLLYKKSQEEKYESILFFSVWVYT